MKLSISLKNDIKDLEPVTHLFERHDTEVSVVDNEIILLLNYPEEENEMNAMSTLIKIGSYVQRFIQSINGASKFVNPAFPVLESAKITYIYKNEKKTIPNPIEISGSFCITGGWYDPVLPEIVSLICDNVFISKVFRLLTRKQDWITLFNIENIIEESRFKFSSSSRKQSKIFSGSANISSVSKDESRHGYIYRYEHPSNEMTINDAQKYIKSLLKEWVYYHINLHRKNNRP